MQDEFGTTGAAAAIDSERHLKDYVSVVLARWWILVSTFVLVVFGVSTWAVVSTPIYRAKALLLIEPVKVNLMDFKSVYDPTLGGVGDGPARLEFYETQYKLILCRPILERTFQEFNFGNMKEFLDVKDPIIAFSKLFSVEPVRSSRLVWVIFEWRDPELAARVLDFLVSEYMLDYRRRSVGVTMGGLEALRKKAAEVKPKVEAKAKELQQFMVENNMVSLEKTQNIIVDRLKEINKNLSDVEWEKIEVESICKNIKQVLQDNRSMDEMPEVAGSTALRDLKLEYIRTKQECNDLDGRFGPNHPEVVAAKARLDTISEKMQEEMKSLFAVAQAQFERTVRQTNELRRELAAQEQRVLAFNMVAIRYNMLKETHDTLSKTYKAIVTRIEEIEIAMASGSEDDNLFVITHPRVPVKPAKPRKAFSIVMASIIGLLSGIGLCFFVNYLDTTVKTKDDIENLMRVPVLGYVPSLQKGISDKSAGNSSKGKDLLTVVNPRSIAAESFRSIRTALAFSSPNEDLRHFLVTSPSPEEGKTLVSANIAIALAQAGKRVLLVDADMRKPRLHKVFAVAASPGLSNILAVGGMSHLRNMVQPVPGIPTLCFLPCGLLPPNPAELLGSSRMFELIGEMSAQFDVTIFDTSPITAVTDAVVLCRYVQGALLIVRSFFTQRESVRRARELLTRAQVKILGVVLNNVDVPRGGYHYYGGGYYNYLYQNYGGEAPKKAHKNRQRSVAPSIGHT